MREAFFGMAHSGSKKKMNTKNRQLACKFKQVHSAKIEKLIINIKRIKAAKFSSIKKRLLKRICSRFKLSTEVIRELEPVFRVCLTMGDKMAFKLAR